MKGCVKWVEVVMAVIAPFRECFFVEERHPERERKPKRRRRLGLEENKTV